MRTETLSILVGVGVVAATVAYLLYRRKNSLKKTLLDPTAKVPLKLLSKEIISHDTRKFRFSLPSKNHILGLPIGQHIFLSASINGETVIRSYTPVTCDDDVGYMDLVIKVYKKGVHPKFPAGGKMSQYLDQLSIGDTVDVRGPSGKLRYLGYGTFSIKVLRKDPPMVISARKINLIAGGTGITPMLQLIRHITKDPEDRTQLALLFANQTENDILLRHELDKIEHDCSRKFKVWYTVDVPSPGWKFGVGFINVNMIREQLYPPTEDTIVLMCGPPPMINFACSPSLTKLGFDASQCFTY